MAYPAFAHHSEPFGGRLYDTHPDNSMPYSSQFPPAQYDPRSSFPRDMPYKEYDPTLGQWRQGPKILREFKPTYFFSRPHDGKRRGAMGRLKDALTGEGADVYITISGDKRTRMRDRPQRWQWTGRGLTTDEIEKRRAFDADFRESDLMPLLGQSTRARQKRAADPYYNFRTRRFEHPTEKWWTEPDHMWWNAQWPEGAKRSCHTPLQKEDVGLNWWSRVPPEMGRWPGGRPGL